jgi:hypothetical protein
MARFLRFFAFLFLLCCLGPTCMAQEITVRVVNGANGQPLQKMPVSVAFLYDGKYDKNIPANHPRGLNLETDINGEARFRFPEPAPTHFSSEIRVDWSRWNCSCVVIGSTDEMITKGTVAATSDSLKSG